MRQSQVRGVCAEFSTHTRGYWFNLRRRALHAHTRVPSKRQGTRANGVPATRAPCVIPSRGLLPSGRFPPLLASLAAPVALSVVVGPFYLVDGAWPGALIALSAWAALLAGIVAPPMPPHARLACAATCGASGALLWATSPEQWVHVDLAVACRLLLVPFTLPELLALGVVGVVPLVLIAGTALAGVTDATRVLLRAVEYAIPARPVLAAHGVAIASAVWLAARSARGDAPRATRPSARSVGMGAIATGALAFELFQRGRVALAEARLPTDANQWSEPPLLMNVLKLREGVPLYGAPGDVSSYTYSPAFELLQAALLAPFGLSLHIVAHRLLVLAWQLGAAGILGSALAPHLGGSTRARRAARAAAVGAAFLALEWRSPASPFLHPDHAVHLVVAVAMAVLVRWNGLSARAIRVAMVVLPPAAVLFKLTGAGVGVGLALVALHERRRDLLAPLALGAVLALATIPLYEALFGHFTEYAITLMAHHAVNWGRLRDAALSPEGRFALAACALSLASTRSPSPASSLPSSPPSSRSPSRPPAKTAVRLALFMVGLGALTVLAFLKEGGRANNLVAPALPALAVAFLLLTERGGSRGFAELASVAALAAVSPDFGPELDPERIATALADHRAAVALVRQELGAGRHPLVHSGTTIWLEGGGRGIPRDRLHPAIELYLAGHPAFETHLQRLASGMYETIITPGQTFVVRTTAGAHFGELMQSAVRARYCVVYPVDGSGRAVPLTFGERLLFLRRRDLGCEPFAAAR